MFTVIICNKRIIDACRKTYEAFLKPYLNSDSYAFCKWNTEGESIEEALPDLNGILSGHSTWRALIVQDEELVGMEQTNKKNPFDYVGAIKTPVDFGSITDFSDLNGDEEVLELLEEKKQQILAYREAKRENYLKAVCNPLTRLAAWLEGSPMRKKPVFSSKIEEFLMNDDGEINLLYFSELYKAGLHSAEIEICRAQHEKYEIASKVFLSGAMIEKKPSRIIALSTRTCGHVEELALETWGVHTELEYSRFYDDNLYHDKLRYLIYDIDYENQFRNESKFLNFLTYILTFATNECPYDAIRANRVYRVQIKADDEKLRIACNNYDGKLRATLNSVLQRNDKLKIQEAEPIDNKTARTVFEKEAVISVEMNSDISESELMAKYKEIGLSRDCPEDELTFWSNQYREISRLFVRYLREPRRAVKKAVSDEMPKMNSIDDERMLRLNEFQREDVVYKLQEEEQCMVETKTRQIFHSAEYNERINEADKELRHAIGQRMNKKRTVMVAVIAAVAYLVGFLPLILGNFNTTKSTLVSLLMTVGSIAVFLIVGFIALIVLRKRLVDRFKHFNYVMGGICGEITESMKSFSKYLSHACSVMREYSVLRSMESQESRKRKILKKHEIDIRSRIETVNRLFADYLDPDLTDGTEDYLPYAYDFSVLCKYNYDMPYSKKETEIDFMQPGFKVTVPIDYMDSVVLIREELYD